MTTRVRILPTGHLRVQLINNSTFRNSSYDFNWLDELMGKDKYTSVSSLFGFILFVIHSLQTCKVDAREMPDYFTVRIEFS